MWVLCLLTVAYLDGNGVIQVKEDRLSGLVLRQNKKTYTADFSLDAKLSKYVGTYKELIVSKDNCVEEIKE